MSFNHAFKCNMFSFTIYSLNKTAHKILSDIKEICHDIDKPDAFDKLLLLAQHIVIVGESGEITKIDQAKLYDLITLAIQQTSMIDKRIQWYTEQLPEVSVTSFDAFHDLVSLHDIIVFDGIDNEHTDRLLIQINYTLDSIKKIYDAILTVV